MAGDAAGLALNAGFTVRGMEYALASGYYAARAVLAAREAGDFSAGSLAAYQRLLDESFVMRDFLSFRETPGVVTNPRFFRRYPEMAGDILRDVYSIPAGPKNRLYPTIRKHLSFAELWHLFQDMRGVMKI